MGIKTINGYVKLQARVKIIKYDEKDVKKIRSG